MRKLLLLVWELPQKLLGSLIIKLSKAEKIGEYKDADVYNWQWVGGLSLSTHIFVPFEFFDNYAWETNYVKHEYGHTIQSKMLGPLYLIVIALPSFLWAWLGKKYRKEKNVSYYSFYTEKWAEKLGGAKSE